MTYIDYSSENRYSFTNWMNFLQKLNKSIQRNNSLLCVGHDPVITKLPSHLQQNSPEDAFFFFNKAIIDATHDLVCCYKPQIAHYSAEGTRGLEALLKTIKYLKKTYSNIPIILDAKRADIGSTSEEYAREAFENIGADALTVNPYLGLDSLEPFLKRTDKGVIILCRTTNPGAKDFQDLLVKGEPLYLHVARKVVEWHIKYGNCLLVVGATWPEELKKVREIAPKLFFLVPGIGAQGGSLKKVIKAGLNKDKKGLIIHISRSIIYASNGKYFAKKAREKATSIRTEINKYRHQTV